MNNAPMLRGCLMTVGVCVALVSAMFAVIFAVELAGGGDGKTQPGVLAGLVIFFGGTLVAGLYLCWRMLRTSRAPASSSAGASRPGPSRAQRRRAVDPVTVRDVTVNSDADRERRILQFAEREHGRVTVAEVAAHCEMTVTQAKTDLDRMVTQQVAELLVTENGVLVYVFPGFLSDDEKASARDF